MEYKRPDVEKYEKDMTALFKEFDEAKTAKECIDVIDKVEQLSVTMNTLSSLVYLHYTINTKDEFYAKEQDFFDDLGPKLGKYGDEYRKRILNCKFRKNWLRNLERLYSTCMKWKTRLSLLQLWTT